MCKLQIAPSHKHSIGIFEAQRINFAKHILCTFVPIKKRVNKVLTDLRHLRNKVNRDLGHKTIILDGYTVSFDLNSSCGN